MVTCGTAQSSNPKGKMENRCEKCLLCECRESPSPIMSDPVSGLVSVSGLGLLLGLALVLALVLVLGFRVRSSGLGLGLGFRVRVRV